MKGIVKWFNDSKGYGFIKPLDNMEKDIFIHYSDIQKTGFKSLIENTSVEFDLQETDKGLKAVNVRILK